MIGHAISRLFTVLLLLQFHSCATDSKIVKQRPNYSLTGAAAKEELERFKIDKIKYNYAHFDKEKWYQYAKGEELNDMLKDVSPKTYELLEETKTKEYLNWVFAAAFLATSFTGRDGNNFIFPPMQWAALGAWIGYDLYLNIDRNQALEQYHQDIRSKFSPSIGYSFSFE